MEEGLHAKMEEGLHTKMEEGLHTKMEKGLHTWPKERRGWRGFCHDWLATDSQQPGLVEEAEVDHVAIKEGVKQVRINVGEKQVRINEAVNSNQNRTGPQRVDLYMELDLLTNSRLK